MTNAPSSGWKRGRFGENLSVTPAACHLPYRGEALAYRKASPLRQRLPYKGSCLRSRLRGWTKDSLTAEKPLRHACGVPPPLSRGGLGIPESFTSSPEAPLQGATATTAASGGNREELLGQRPAGCKRQRSRRWEPQPGLGERSRLRGWTEDDLALREERESFRVRLNPSQTTPSAPEG